MIGSIIGRTLLAAPLLTLFFVAFGFVGALFWFAGFFIMIVALRHFFGELKKGRRRTPLLVLSLATIALFFGACGNHVRAYGQLSREARAFADEVHAQCNRDRACPLAASVCTSDGYACREAGSLGVQLPIRYHVDDSRQSFTVSSSLASDDATTYEGGVARALTRRFSIDGEDDKGEVIMPYDGGAP